MRGSCFIPCDADAFVLFVCKRDVITQTGYLQHIPCTGALYCIYIYIHVYVCVDVQLCSDPSLFRVSTPLHMYIRFPCLARNIYTPCSVQMQIYTCICIYVAALHRNCVDCVNVAAKRSPCQGKRLAACILDV